jgi:transcription elongation factor B subunit 1
MGDHRKAKTVKLVSAEGFEFIIDYKAACVSNTIRNMLSSQGGYNQGNVSDARV